MVAPAESVRQHWKLMQGAGTPKSSAKTPKQTPKAPPPTPKTPAAAVAAGPSKALGVFMAVVLIAGHRGGDVRDLRAGGLGEHLIKYIACRD